MFYVRIASRNKKKPTGNPAGFLKNMVTIYNIFNYANLSRKKGLKIRARDRVHA
jgi:hypothetical protein